MRRTPRTTELRSARLYVGVVAWLLAGLVSGRSVDPDPAAAQGSDALGAIAAESEPMQRGGVSLQEAIQIATRQHPGGRVARAVTIENGGRRIHEIRIVLPPDEGGRVVTVSIPAGDAR